MGTIPFDQKYKNMEMELELHKNYIHNQNLFFKNKLQSKEDEHRREMNNMLLQKNSMIEKQKHELDEVQPKLKTMNQVNALLQSKDNTIQQLRQQNNSWLHDKELEIQQLRCQLDEARHELNNMPLVNDLLKSKDTEIEKLDEIIASLKQKNIDLEALNEQELRSHSTALADARKHRTEAENALEKKLQSTIKRLDVPNYKDAATITILREEIQANRKLLERKEGEIKISSEKLALVHNVISKLKRDTQEKLKLVSSAQVENDDIYRTKYEKRLEIIGDECDVIIEKIEEGSTMDFSVITKLEETIESLRNEIEYWSGNLEGKSCLICTQPLVFPKCTECNEVFHGECIYRTFLVKNSPECCCCTNQSIKLSFDFVPVQRQERNNYH